MKGMITKIVAVVIVLNLSAYSNNGEASIENTQVSGSTFSWEVHYTRTDNWTSGFFSDALGNSSASFNVNLNALANPTITLNPGGPLDNTNYTVTVQIVGGKCIMDIQFGLNELSGKLSLNVNTKLATISMDITNVNKTAGLTWDNANTGFFDNADATVTTTLTGSSNQPLPIELSSFTAEAKENKVELSWETATEINNYGFEIERTAPLNTPEGMNYGEWKKIGFVDGAGNSNSPKSYRFVDKNFSGGTRFKYRLKQIDNDGRFEYSDVVEVEIIPDKFLLYQNYPNPFNPATRIKFNLPETAEVNLSVYNTLGEFIKTLVAEKKEAGYYEYNFNGTNLSSGIYIYRLTAGNKFVSVKKMILLK